MSEFSEAYLRQYYDNCKFFNPQCRNNILREQMMRTKECHKCSGLEQCRLHPHFWLEGEQERFNVNEKLKRILPQRL